LRNVLKDDDDIASGSIHLTMTSKERIGRDFQRPHKP
jgi:hypothetical protein